MARRRNANRRRQILEPEAEQMLEPIWHPMRLQQMPPGRFESVVNRILDGTHSVASGTLTPKASRPEDKEGA